MVVNNEETELDVCLLGGTLLARLAKVFGKLKLKLKSGDALINRTKRCHNILNFKFITPQFCSN